MKAKYRGYEIEVRRERCMGGWSMLYFTIIRLSDNWICLDSFSDSEDTVKDMVSYLKERIDNEQQESDPWGEKRMLANDSLV